MKQYYSESKGEFVNISEMATPHLTNAINKMKCDALTYVAERLTSLMRLVESRDLPTDVAVREAGLLDPIDYIDTQYFSLMREARRRKLEVEEI